MKTIEVEAIDQLSAARASMHGCSVILRLVEPTLILGYETKQFDYLENVTAGRPTTAYFESEKRVYEVPFALDTATNTFRLFSGARFSTWFFQGLKTSGKVTADLGVLDPADREKFWVCENPDFRGLLQSQAQKQSA